MCGWRAISLLDKIQENRYYLAGWSLVEKLRTSCRANVKGQWTQSFDCTLCSNAQQSMILSESHIYALARIWLSFFGNFPINATHY